MHAWMVCALVALLVVIAWRWDRGRWSRASRARQRVARAGEDAAERLLVEAGYEVVDRQVGGTWSLVVDGEAIEVSCRADLVVARRGRPYVAEVKTGDRAPDPTLPSTRRQLLEYRVAFPDHGLLLVDMAEERILEVDL